MNEEMNELFGRMMDFVKKNNSDFRLYDDYARAVATTFSRILPSLPEKEQEEAIATIKEGRYLTGYYIVRKPSIAEWSRVERNYNELRDYFFNHLSHLQGKPAAPPKGTTGAYTLEELAIYLYYEDPYASEDKINDLLEENGLTSYDKLCQHLNNYREERYRTGERHADTRKTVQNRLRRFEKVKPIITSESGRKRIENDIVLIENLIDSY